MDLDEIIDALEDEREQLLDAIDGLSDEQMLEPGVVENWSIKDLLHHMAMWEAELVKLLWQAAQGVKPSTVHSGDLDVDQINANWYAQGKYRPLDLVMNDYIGVRRQTLRRVEAFSRTDLTDPQRYAWLDGEPLWVWIAEDSFRHEAGHAEQIRQWRSRKGL